MSEQSSKNSAGRGAGFALLAFGTFATHDAIVKTLGETYSVFQIIFFSILFGFVPVVLMVLADKSEANLRPHHPMMIAGRAATMMVSMVCAFYAFTVLPLAETYALLFATPLLITVLSVPLLGEEVRRRRWIAVIVGFIGVVIVLRPGVTPINLGHVAALMAAVSGALSSIIVRRIGSLERSAVLILYPMLANMIVMALILPWVYLPMPAVDLGLAASVGILMAIAQIFVIAAYRCAPAAVIAPFQYSQIVWAIPFGFVLFGDSPDIWVGVGALIIVASGLFVVWRETRSGVSETNPVLSRQNFRPDTGPVPRFRRNTKHH